jgi:hypothetical protein
MQVTHSRLWRGAVAPCQCRAQPDCAGVVNGASFQSGPVAPGEIVSLFGSAIGPPTPALLA